MKIKYCFVLFFMLSIFNIEYLYSQSRRSADVLNYDGKIKLFTYTGNAKLDDKDTTITSYIMKFFREDEIANFNGSVKMLSKEYNSTIESGYANYDGKQKFAYATIDPVLKSPTNNLTIKSKFMERDFNTPFAKALTNVHLIHIDITNKKQTDGYSKELVYNMDEQISIMKGEPYLIQGNDKLYGEIIEYNSKNSQANVIGNAKVYILQTNKAREDNNNTNNNSSESNTNRSKSLIPKLAPNPSTGTNKAESSSVSNYNLVVADRLFLDDKTGESNKRMLYGYGNVTAYFYEENMILKGEYIVYDIDSEHMFVYNSPSVRVPDKGIVAFGDWIEYKKDGEYKDVIFHDNVSLYYYDDSMSVEGGLVHLDPDTKIVTASIDPYAYLENKEIRVKSISMQLFNDQEKLRANGDVIVNNEDIESNSAWAVYLDKDRTIKFWGGNPIVVQAGSAIHAKELMYFVETQRVQGSIVSGEMPR